MNRSALFGILCLAATVGRAAPPEVSAEQLPRIEPTPADKAAATFVVRPGFHMELMAAEPLIADPVAIAFDEDARAYVVEMRDYSERRDEKLGRVKLLTDDDGDGKYDRASTFVEGLPWPTGVTCWDGGVFVVSSPDLWYFKDTDNDGKADVRALVCTGFGNLTDRLNVQALPNSLQWGPDQRIHLALGGNASRISNFAVQSQPALELRGKDLSFDPRKFDFRAETGGGQWGMTFDALGRKYVCSNSRHLQQVIYPEFATRTLPSLPQSVVDIAEDGPQAEVFRASPVEAWRILRTEWRVTGVVPGLIEGGGRASGYFTSACGVTIYSGDAYPPEFSGNAFIADCGGNLIHRKTLHGEIRRTARRAADEQKSEFVAGKDNWFRPVALANAPDGCLWACDMYREIVEHPWSLPEPIKKRLDLNAGNDRGRLWRIAPNYERTRKSTRMSGLTAAELVPFLNHPNGWHRETAARLLHQKADSSIVDSLQKLVREAPTEEGRIGALRVLAYSISAKQVPWDTTLDGKLLPPVALNVLGDIGNEKIWLFGRQSLGAFGHLRTLRELTQSTSSEVRFRVALLAFRLSEDERDHLLNEVARQDVTAPELRSVLTSAADGKTLLPLLRRVGKTGQPDQIALAGDLLVAEGRTGDPNFWSIVIAALQKEPIAQREAYLAKFAEGARQSGRTLWNDTSRVAFEKIIDEAADIVRNREAASAERILAIRLLSWTGDRDQSRLIADAIHPRMPAGEAVASIEAIDRLQPDGIAAIFTQLWPMVPATARSVLLQTWRSRIALVPYLLDAIEAKTIPIEEISTTDVAALRAITDEKIQARVTTIFGSVGSREAALETYRPALTQTGAAIAGAATFKAKCAVCHRKGGEGTPIGPDLDAAVSAGKEKILGNILDPSREVTAGFAAGAVETVDGEVLTGIITAEANGGVTLKIPNKGTRTFAKPEIEQFKRLTKSLMPEGIEAGLSVREMSDLLAFLTTTTKAAARLPLDQFRKPDGAVAQIESQADWKVRREDILTKMQEIMGPLPGDDRKVDFAVKIEEETDMGTYVRRLITYATERESRITAYLLIPKKCLEPNATPVSAILCLHPTDNTFGHKVVVGLGGKANRQYASELAERGFVTIAPSYPLLAAYQPDLEKLGYVSGTMKAIHDNRRTLDYLDTLPFVRHERYAAIGHSLGGHNSVFTAAFDKRLVAVVSSCGLDAFADYKNGEIAGWTSTRYMPRLAAFKGRAHETPFDFDEVLAAIAPRAVRIVAPTKDDNFKADSVDRISGLAREVFKLFESGDKLIVEHPDCGHDFPDDARQRAYEFLARELGPG